MVFRHDQWVFDGAPFSGGGPSGHDLRFRAPVDLDKGPGARPLKESPRPVTFLIIQQIVGASPIDASPDRLDDIPDV